MSYINSSCVDLYDYHSVSGDGQAPEDHIDPETGQHWELLS